MGKPGDGRPAVPIGIPSKRAQLAAYPPQQPSEDPYQWTPLQQSRYFKHLKYERKRPIFNQDPNQNGQRHLSELGRDTLSVTPGALSTSFTAKGRGPRQRYAT